MAIVAAASPKCLGPLRKKESTQQMLDYIAQAKEKGVQLIVFPELIIGFPTASMDSAGSKDIMNAWNESEFIPEGETTQTMIKAAAENNMYIVWTMAERTHTPAIMKNTAVIVGPEGYVGKTSKMHTVKSEKLMFAQGNEFPVYETSLGRIGIMVCYDIHFPEVFRTYVHKGVDFVICPMATGGFAQREDDFEYIRYSTIKRARALENMTPLIVSTYGGYWDDEHPEHGCGIGHSCVIGASGEMLAETGWDPGMAVAEIDFRESILRARTQAMLGANLIADRRPELYGAVTER